ncbi:MAG: FtsX-like permease family protein [Pseudomonadota bacterium]
MFRNYLMTALRNHLRQGGYTLISLAGLTLGIAVSALVFIYVWQETHYDRQIPDAQRLYIGETLLEAPGRASQLLLTTQGPLADEAVAEVAGVEASTRAWIGWYTVSIDDRLEFNHQLGAVDTNFPRLLGLKMLEGSADALDDLSATLLSRSMAQRLFGEGPYLGQRVTFGGQNDLQVMGVYEDMPSTSHLELHILTALEAKLVTDRGVTPKSDWSLPSVFSYFKLAPGTDPGAAGEALQAIARRNTQAPDGVAVERYLSFFLEPVTALHLNGKNYAQAPKPRTGNATALVIATTIALLVLGVACINTVNIATARSADRAHEVAIRKVVGATREQLVIQFLGESALLTLLATLIALMLAEISVGILGELRTSTTAATGGFVDQTLSLSVLLQPAAMMSFAALLLLVVLLSGLYPAFVLANYKPARIFHPGGTGSRGQGLRTVLVVFQFATSIALIVMAGTVWQQVRYLESADLGFDRGGVVLLNGVRRGPAGTIELTRKLDQAIEGRPGIEFVAGTHSSPSWDYADDGRVHRSDRPADTAVTVDRLAVDTDFFSVLRVEPLAGRVFSEDFGPDRAQWDLESRGEVELPLVLNVSAASSLGYGVPSDAVGVAMRLELAPGDARNGRVVGIVPDFHFKSLKTRINPMVFFPDPTRFNTLMVRFDPRQRGQALASIEEGWTAVLPSQALSQEFLDRQLVVQYVTEQRQFTVLATLAAIAIFIAVLGLVGLLAHAIAARRHEISLRKVMGAEVIDLLRLFLWQFSRPVLVASLIAWPIAWVLSERWLDSFAYRVDTSLLLFVTSGALALAITWGLTAIQVVRVSGTRPAEVLQAG